MHGPRHIEKCANYHEMRTPLLIKILKTVTRVSGIEGFHCIAMVIANNRGNQGYIVVCTGLAKIISRLQ